MTKPNEARQNSLDVAHDASITWRYTAPEGHTLQDCLRPDYWHTCLREIGQQRVIGRHAFNRIEILAADGTWEAELRVMSISDGQVITRLLREWHAPSNGRSEPAVPEGYKVEHIGGNGWRALDRHGNIITEKKSDRGAALQAAISHSAKGKGAN